MTKKLYLKQEVLSEINSYNNELCIRRKKLLKLRKKGIAFPNNFRRNAISGELYKKYSKKNNQELKKLHVEINIAGRMIHRRILGKASFVVLQDMGGKIQVYITCNVLPKNIYEKCFKHWDLGDILGVSGTLFKTKTGELSVFCKTIQLLTKSLRPLPDKFHGLNNQETRYRQRYLDLISNYKIKEIFKIRSLIISEIRRFMLDRNFMEVETPMIQMIPGGASARPFITKHNTLNLDMYLRISPELYLKKLVVGGFERIFEINRNFRNEGISSNHSPEFTMIEIYMAYSDYKDLIDLIQQLLYNVAIKVFNNSIIHYGNYSFDLEKPFDQMTMQESINYYLPEIKFKNIYDSETIISIAKSFGIKVDDQWRLEMIHMAIFEEVVERRIINPTCITSYPIEVSPLARRNDDNPFFADRFEIFIAGKEIGNGFSELNDPEDQLERFLNQKKNKNIQDNNGCNELSKDFITYDKDYITALEHGLPPTAGVGIGIDRLIMLFTNMKNIRDVILFPILRESEKK